MHGGVSPLLLPLAPSLHHLPNSLPPVGYTCRGDLSSPLFRRSHREHRRTKLFAASRLSSFFASKIGLDSQAFQIQDASQQSWIGPVPGDIAEVEAYCRIFRAAEQLHVFIMESLCNPVTGECAVSYDIPSEDMSIFEEKVVAVLGCMVALLNRGREDVLSGRASIMNSFRISEAKYLEDKLPPLAVFRGEMKRCSESLHVALEKYLTPSDDRITEIWRRLQRLKNVCYDAGYPRSLEYPCQTVFANWGPVLDSIAKEDNMPKDEDVAFWRGGQVTEEGLGWLIDNGYKTIVDLRAEPVNDKLYEAAIGDAISSQRVELVKIPVEVKTAPSVQQVEQFASLVSNLEKRPIYLHSQEGVWRTSAMVSRWRQYTARFQSQFTTNFPSNTKENGGEDETPQISKNGSLLKSLDTSYISTEKFSKQGSFNNENQEKLGIDSHSSSHRNGSVREAVSAEKEIPMNLREIDPLKAQFPACDIFSKSEMSVFFKNKKVSPSIFFHRHQRKVEMLPTSKSKTQVNTHDKGSSGTVNLPKKSTLSERELLYVPTKSRVEYSPVSAALKVNGLSDTKSLDSSNGVAGKYTHATQDVLKKENAKLSSISVDDDLQFVERDMCASATGVVRVQSRKKAEMFLVRTDGFSCTREKVTESSLAFTHPSTQQQMLMWKSLPRTVLLLKKLGQELMEEAKEAAAFLYYQEKMNVLVEPDVHDIFARIPGFGFVQTFYSQDTSDLHERVDFVACLGGDGVILHASNLFRGAVPPVVSFNLGSLGFLTSHTFDDFKRDLGAVIHGNNTVDGVYITLRMRLRCEIFRKGKAIPGKVFDVLNEVVVDRGSNPYLSKIECYEHDRLITKVQGDGVIVATPTGSTAYSTAAGGSMVHPNVPCMLFTPICPHSLSFRPVILPDSARLELKIPDDTRSNAWVSFDGKRRQQLSRGDSIRICMSQHPLPTVNKSDQTGDWFHSLIRCLNWNERLDQKAL